MRKKITVIPQETKDKVANILNTLESFLNGHQWFSESDNVSIADLSIFANFSTLYHFGFDISSYPNLSAWYKRCKKLPGAEENEMGAKSFGDNIKSKLTEPL